MQIDMSQEDFGTLCICAIRYCQGRETYMPTLVKRICRQHMSEISDKDINVMIDDCRFQDYMDLYGDETIDKPDWVKWKEDLIEEKKRRQYGSY